MNVLDKISLSTTDYVVLIRQDKKVVEKVASVAKGVTCSGGDVVKGHTFVKSPADLDKNAYTKVIAKFTEGILSATIKSCDHLGLVLLRDVPFDQKRKLVNQLSRRGIYEWWDIQSSKTSQDLLFKVRKYPKN